MAKLTLLVFLLSIISSGYLQEYGNYQLPQNNENTDTNKELWLQQFQGLRRNGKPCRRRNNNPDGPWLPTQSPQVSRPIYEPALLQPQALKNEEYKDFQASPIPETHELNLGSGRRSLDQTTDDDCVDQLSTVHVGPSGGPDAEKTALKIIEDCLKKKKKQDALVPSRRSMSYANNDIDKRINNDDSNLSRYSEVEESSDSPKLDDDKLDNSISFRRLEPSVRNGSEESAGLASRPNDLSNLRICYACSTATNPTCWEPDQKTTIKYCRREHSCVTKTFGVKNQVTLIRDCANSCDDTSVPGIEPKYKSCKLCNNDYCNSAINIAINGYNLAIVLIVSIVKCIY